MRVACKGLFCKGFRLDISLKTVHASSWFAKTRTMCNIAFPNDVLLEYQCAIFEDLFWVFCLSHAVLSQNSPNNQINLYGSTPGFNSVCTFVACFFMAQLTRVLLDARPFLCVCKYCRFGHNCFCNIALASQLMWPAVKTKTSFRCLLLQWKWRWPWPWGLRFPWKKQDGFYICDLTEPVHLDTLWSSTDLIRETVRMWDDTGF